MILKISKNMNKIILIYLAIFCIGIFLEHVQAETAIDVDELSACDHVSHKIDVLKSGNDNLKLHFEIMNHRFERYQHEVEGKFNTLEYIIQKLVAQQTDNQNELKQLIGSMVGKDCAQDQSDSVVNAEKPEILRELQKITKLQEDIITKLDTNYLLVTNASFSIDSEVAVNPKSNVNAVENEGVSVCGDMYTKILNELSSNLTILQSIDSKLNKLNEHYDDEVEKQTKAIAVTHSLQEFLTNKEDITICVRSNDEKLVCATEPYPTSCTEYNSIHCANGKCRIQNPLYSSKSFLVACDDTTDKGGWMVIQRRINGSVDFYRGWSEYKTGFGNVDGEFWIGLDKLHALTSTLAPVELLIQLKDHNDTLKYAKYGKFSIASELEKYELKEADGYEGNAGDSFGIHKSYKFTTKDMDNDVENATNCAVDKKGAWWYSNCQSSNLNGIYYKNGSVPENERGEGINWYHFHGFNYSLKFVQMMIRPKKA